MFRTLFAAIVAAVGIASLTLPASAQQGEQLETTAFGDWSRECGMPPGATQKLCQLTQWVKNPNGGERIVGAVIIKAQGQQQAAAVLRFIVPLGIWLRPGIDFNIDGKSSAKLSYEFCNAKGCIAQMPLSAGQVAALKRGANANISIRSIRRQKLDLKVSLRGFTAGYDSM